MKESVRVRCKDVNGRLSYKEVSRLEIVQNSRHDSMDLAGGKQLVFTIDSLSHTV